MLDDLTSDDALEGVVLEGQSGSDVPTCVGPSVSWHIIEDVHAGQVRKTPVGQVPEHKAASAPYVQRGRGLGHRHQVDDAGKSRIDTGDIGDVVPVVVLQTHAFSSTGSSVPEDGCVFGGSGATSGLMVSALVMPSDAWRCVR